METVAFPAIPDAAASAREVLVAPVPAPAAVEALRAWDLAAVAAALAAVVVAVAVEVLVVVVAVAAAAEGGNK